MDIRTIRRHYFHCKGIAMNHSISSQRNILTLTVDKQEQLDLISVRSMDAEEMPGMEWGSDSQVYYWFEDFIANSEFEWVDASETGDLTDSPMLGIRNEEWIVTERWAYLIYETHYILDDLIEKGSVILVGGN